MSATDKEKYRKEYEYGIATSALVDYQLYLALCDTETNVRYKELFSELAQIAKERFSFWGTKAHVRGDVASRPLFIHFVRMLRMCIGAKRTARFLVGREKKTISKFEVYCVDCLDAEEKKAIETMIARSYALIATLDV